MADLRRSGLLEAFLTILAGRPKPVVTVEWRALSANLRAFQPTDRRRAA